MWTFLSDWVHIQAVASVLVAVVFIIGSARLQQKVILKGRAIITEPPPNIKSTSLYEDARIYVECRARAIENYWKNPAFRFPMLFLASVVGFCSIVSYMGAEYFMRSAVPSYVLGGVLATDPAVPVETLVKYQSQTVLVGCVAFLTAYVWMIVRLFRRVNNYDVSPITYYFLSIHLLAACAVAGFARHIVEAVPYLRDIIHAGNPYLAAQAQGGQPLDLPWGLVLLGFVIGLKPLLWIDKLYAIAAAAVKSFTAEQRSPAANELPQNMTLTMIQGLDDDRIIRLAELDIGNCHKLSRENAIVVWLRTPYNLELIVDWIAQAQLCILFEPGKIQALREKGIRDIFAYANEAGEASALAELQKIVGAPLEIIKKHKDIIAADPAYQRLDELRKALCVKGGKLAPPSALREAAE